VFACRCVWVEAGAGKIQQDYCWMPLLEAIAEGRPRSPAGGCVCPSPRVCFAARPIAPRTARTCSVYASSLLDHDARSAQRVRKAGPRGRSRQLHRAHEDRVLLLRTLDYCHPNTLHRVRLVIAKERPGWFALGDLLDVGRTSGASATLRLNLTSKLSRAVASGHP